MRERNKIILEYGTYMLSFFVSYIASLAKWYYASGIILIVEAVYLYVHWVRESGSFVELRALFTLAWVGGQGISCLKLSTLQDTWSYITWLSFFVIYIAFGIGYEWGRKYSRVEGKEPEKNNKNKSIFSCVLFSSDLEILSRLKLITGMIDCVRTSGLNPSFCNCIRSST